MPGDRYALRAEGVRKVFGRNEVLTAASLWAETGKVTTLLGRNGSGKTTLMRVAAGLLRPDQGVVALHGSVVRRPSLAQLARRGLMFLPQGRLLVRGYTVRAHFAALVRVVGPGSVEAAIETVGIADVLDQQVTMLSGGERTRASLALALARQPTVLLADEPLVGLAPIDQEELGQLLRDIAARGVAVVTSGHDTSVLLEISDVIIWCVSGTTHHIGTPADAVAHEQFRREYLARG